MYSVQGDVHAYSDHDAGNECGPSVASPRKQKGSRDCWQNGGHNRSCNGQSYLLTVKADKKSNIGQKQTHRPAETSEEWLSDTRIAAKHTNQARKEESHESKRNRSPLCLVPSRTGF
jgi:hypothetical protein